MRALVLEGAGRLVPKEVDAPLPAKDEEIIEVEITGIGGSETLALDNPGLRPLPSIMGHGVCGTTGDGRRVAVFPLSGCRRCAYCQDDQAQLCNDWRMIGVHSDGGFAEQLAVPSNSLVELPPDLSWEQASFVEPFANALNAWERAAPDSGQSVAVVGLGAIGFGLLATAQARGVVDVSACDLSAARRSAAEALGANQLTDQLEGRYDVVFDTVGTESTRDLSIRLTKKNGICVFLGFATRTQPVDFVSLIREQKTLVGSFAFSREQFARAMPLAACCWDDWVRNLAMNDVEAELRRFASGDYSSVRSVLRPTL